MPSGAVYVVGTFDTKGAELAYAARCVAEAGAAPVTVDISTTPSFSSCDVPAIEVAGFHPEGSAAVLGIGDRGKAVTEMAQALSAYLLSRKNIGAVLGLGGSGNTSMVTTAMRALPFGVPKIMVSTLASGNVEPFVGPSDIMMLHSVADIAGLNAITRSVIGNAAHAAAGMALNAVASVPSPRVAVGMTMFGVTTKAATQIRERLGERFEVFIFHATGIGGQCFEKLVDSGFLGAAIDLTTTEVADYLCDGMLKCTEDRFGGILRKRIPYVGSVGAVDMINFGAADTVPERFRGRLAHAHNPVVTLLRTSPEENGRIGRWIVERVNGMEGPVRFLLPLRGVSTLDAAGQPFYDPAADTALFDAVRRNWKHAPHRKLVEIDAHINDATFADEAVACFNEILDARSR